MCPSRSLSKSSITSAAGSAGLGEKLFEIQRERKKKRAQQSRRGVSSFPPPTRPFPILLLGLHHTRPLPLVGACPRHVTRPSPRREVEPPASYLLQSASTPAATRHINQQRGRPQKTSGDDEECGPQKTHRILLLLRKQVSESFSISGRIDDRHEFLLDELRVVVRRRPKVPAE